MRIALLYVSLLLAVLAVISLIVPGMDRTPAMYLIAGAVLFHIIADLAG